MDVASAQRVKGFDPERAYDAHRVCGGLGGWRGDVVATLDSTGARRETIRYSTYGLPFGIAAGDVDGSGSVVAGDASAVNAQIGKSYGVSGYTVLLDVDLDGDVDVNDYNVANGQSGLTLGHSALSAAPTTADGGNRIGYAGYAWEPVSSKYAVRHRVFDPLRGRWSRRDPLGYVDSPTLYSYVNDRAMAMIDPKGMIARVTNITLPECDLAEAFNRHGEGEGPKVAPLVPMGDEGPKSPNPRACQGGENAAGEDPEITRCKDGLKKEWDNNQKTQKLKDGITSRACSLPARVCIKDDLLCPPGRDGGYDYKNNILFICAGNSAVPVSVTLVHELVHAYDNCLGKLQNSCSDIACSEIRAYDYDGECADPSKRQGVESYPECIARKAGESTNDRKDPTDPAGKKMCTADAVGPMMPSCYDTIDKEFK